MALAGPFYFPLAEATAKAEHMDEKVDEFEKGIVGCANEGIGVLVVIVWQIRYSKRKAVPHWYHVDLLQEVGSE